MQEKNIYTTSYYLSRENGPIEGREKRKEVESKKKKKKKSIKQFVT